jgi:hypothetical protein
MLRNIRRKRVHQRRDRRRDVAIVAGSSLLKGVY